MLAIPANLPVFVHRDAVDFRNGIDGLVAMCKNELSQDPFSGAAFLFINRRRHAIKILCYDGQGFWLMQKRLSEGKFRWWPLGDKPNLVILAKELQVFIHNGNPDGSAFANDWRPIMQMEGRSSTPNLNEGGS